MAKPHHLRLTRIWDTEKEKTLSCILHPLSHPVFFAKLSFNQLLIFMEGKKTPQNQNKQKSRQQNNPQNVAWVIRDILVNPVVLFCFGLDYPSKEGFYYAILNSFITKFFFLVSTPGLTPILHRHANCSWEKYGVGEREDTRTLFLERWAPKWF